jgi:hypothetical protein
MGMAGAQSRIGNWKATVEYFCRNDTGNTWSDPQQEPEHQTILFRIYPS